MSSVIYSEFCREIIISVDPQTIPNISLTPTPFSDETFLLYNLWPTTGKGIRAGVLLCFWEKQNRPPSSPNSNPLLDYLVFDFFDLHLNETPSKILALLCKRSRS
jgi:hypothetical protein